VDEKEALKEQAIAVLNKAEIDYKRQKKLFDDKQIGTADTVEKLESNLIQSKASVKHVDTLIQLSKEQVSQAKASLEIAKKDLKDTVVKAPISGVISAKFHDVGDMGTPGVPVFQIENNNDLEASFYISSQLYSAVQLGNMVKIFSNGEKIGEYKLTYKSPSIDKMLRVFEIKADLAKNDKIAPGSLINGVINLRKFNSIGVPVKSIIKKQDGDVIFRCETRRQNTIITLKNDYRNKETIID
jgi:RND family efflux transporter MFP subunit